MPGPTGKFVMLMADDDENDRESVREACKELTVAVDLRFVGDGVELMDYLVRGGDYGDEIKSPKPDLILLDLHIPRKNGHQVLRAIRSDDSFRGVPVIIFSATGGAGEVGEAFELGANAFIPKKAAAISRLKEIIGIYQAGWARAQGSR